MPRASKQSRRAVLSLGVATLGTSSIALATVASFSRESEAMTKPDLASNKAQADVLASFKGMKLRVVGPGEVVTMEYDANRLTIGVDAEKRILQMYVG